jgi:hypothetical protein
MTVMIIYKYFKKVIWYFEKIEDIDFDFIKQNIEIEYNYRNENSPTKLLSFIEGMLIK